jgi:hypothetical protein
VSSGSRTRQIPQPRNQTYQTSDSEYLYPVMNRLLPPLLAFLFSSASLVAQQFPDPQKPSADSGDAAARIQATLLSRAPDHRIWQRVTRTKDPLTGSTVLMTNLFTELATGITHWNADHSALVDSSPEISITPVGAKATNTAHTVTFLGNINRAGAVSVILPQGETLALSPLCLGYFDSSTKKSVLLGEIKDSYGLLLPSGTEALYPDAYSDVKVDLVFVNSILGLEQLVVFRERLPDPTEWGLNPDTTYLQAITEIVSGPIPRVSAVLTDETEDNDLDFGSMQMVRGVGFAIGAETNAVRVSKHYALLDGRRCLIEQVPFTQVEVQIQDLDPALPKSGSLENSPDATIQRLASHTVLPARRPNMQDSPQMKVAKEAPSFKGFAMDFTLVGNQTNLTLQSGVFYYVPGTVNVSGTLTIEGATTITYSNTPAATIIASNVVCATGAYRPARFTAGDPYGNPIVPTNTYHAGIALDLSTATASLTLSNVQFTFLSNALKGASLVLRNAQFHGCKTGFAAGSHDIKIYNGLASKIDTFINENSHPGDTFTAQNLTAHFCTNFMYDLTGTIKLTNCLFACVTNWQCATKQTNSTAILVSDTGVFQTVGNATHYLAADSPYLTGANSNLDSVLIGDLKSKTVYPPLVTDSVIITVDQTLWPCAGRDTSCSALGYHYEPLDYVFHQTGLSNAVFEVLPGTAVGTYDISLACLTGSSLHSRGTPLQPNRMVPIALVQEHSTTNWDSTGSPRMFSLYYSNITASFEFTDWVGPGSFLVGYGDALTRTSVANSQFHGGLIEFYNGFLSLSNNFCERTSITFYDFVYQNLTVTIQNCEFYNSPNLYWWHFYGGPWTIRDTLFDQSVVSSRFYAPVIADHNGFTTGSARPFTNATDVVASLTYQTGPLGRYYQPTNSAFINMGSSLASGLGLYHFTILTNQTKEASSTVDIGFHYVATDANGAPLDGDGDGAPDYLEDANGNGVFDALETSWQGYNSPNGLASGSGLQVFTPLK